MLQGKEKPQMLEKLNQLLKVSENALDIMQSYQECNKTILWKLYHV